MKKLISFHSNLRRTRTTTTKMFMLGKGFCNLITLWEPVLAPCFPHPSPHFLSCPSLLLAPVLLNIRLKQQGVTVAIWLLVVLHLKIPQGGKKLWFILCSCHSWTAVVKNCSFLLNQSLSQAKHSNSAVVWLFYMCTATYKSPLAESPANPWFQLLICYHMCHHHYVPFLLYCSFVSGLV